MFETGSKYYTACCLLNSCFFDRGKVILAKHKNSGSLVAIKHFNLEEMTHEQYDLVTNEVIRMRQLKHPNIICCFTTYVINFDLYIVSPMMSYTSCHDLITTHFPDGLPELAISYFLRDILRGLDYLHSKGFIHRAVKARHILVHSDGHSCLSGLRYMYTGECKKVYDFPIHGSQNLNWMSPEILEQSANGYDERSDVYSVSVTACELANGIVPFSEASTTLMLTEKMRGVSPQLLDRKTLYYEEPTDDYDRSKLERRQFSDAFHAFVELCGDPVPAARPQPRHLLAHSFFKQARRPINVQQLLSPAVPYTEANTAELNDLMDDLARRFDDVNLPYNEWEF